MTHGYYRLFVYYVIEQLIILISNHVTITLHYKVLWEVSTPLMWDHGVTDKKLPSFLLRTHSSKSQCGSTFEFFIPSDETVISHPVRPITTTTEIMPCSSPLLQKQLPFPQVLFPFLLFLVPKDIPI